MNILIRMQFFSCSIKHISKVKQKFLLHKRKCILTRKKQQTPSKKHMHDMVMIDTIVFDIVGERGGGAGLLKLSHQDR